MKDKIGDTDGLGEEFREPTLVDPEVLEAVTAVLGSELAARAYLEAKNFALGGLSPLQVLREPGGKGLVLNELQTHLNGGPI